MTFDIGKLQWCFDARNTRANHNALFVICTKLQRESVFPLWVSLANHKLHVTENYHGKLKPKCDVPSWEMPFTMVCATAPNDYIYSLFYNFIEPACC